MSTPQPVHVLDTNVFVQAHRRHYAFEICPGFWDCLIHHHKTGLIVSIDRVRDEILAGDALETWVKDTAPSTLFASTADTAITTNYASMLAGSTLRPNSGRKQRQSLRKSRMDGSVLTPKLIPNTSL